MTSRLLAEELFGTSKDIPPGDVRELKCYVDTATAKLGLVRDRHQRGAYWIDGRSLGAPLAPSASPTQTCKCTRSVAKIRQLDHLTFVDLTVAVVYDKEPGNRRLSPPTRDGGPG